MPPPSPLAVLPVTGVRMSVRVSLLNAPPPMPPAVFVAIVPFVIVAVAEL